MKPVKKRYDADRVEYLLGLDRTPDNVNELVELNLGLVYTQLGKFYLTKDDDAISLAYEALYRAIMGFEVGKNKFSTYAIVCIYNTLGSYVRSLNTQIIKNTISYDVPVGDNITMRDVLCDDISLEESVISNLGIEVIQQAIYECVDNIENGIYRAMVNDWVSSDFTKKQTEIASDFGYTQSNVSKVIKSFKYDLKKKLEALSVWN